MKMKKIITLILLICIAVSLVTACDDKLSEVPLFSSEKDLSLEEEVGIIGAIGGLITDEYNGYLGYGYNVVSSGYFNGSDVSSTAEILNTDLLLLDKRLYSQEVSDTGTTLHMGETLQSYQQEVSRNIGLSFSYGVFSKIKADFSLSSDMSASGMSKSVFIKNQIKIKKERQYIRCSDLEIEDLEKYVNKKFLRLLNADVSAKNDEEKQKYYVNIFEVYGTHVLMDIMLGGRMDLNYVYNNSSNETISDIKASLDATYETFSAEISGSVSEEKSNRARKFSENSTFTASRVGGSVAPDINTYQKALDSYKEWALSIDEKKSLDFFDVGSNCVNSLLPIWEFAKTEEKSDEVILAYEKYVSSAGKFFADLDKSIGRETMPLYVKNIYFSLNDKAAVAMSDIDAQIAQKEPDYLKKVILPYDLNEGAGGSYVYLGYTLTDNPDEAITEIRVQSYHSMDNILDKRNEGFTTILTDLNYGVKRDGNRGGAYIISYYSKDKAKGDPIKEIGIEIDGVYSFGSVGTGWAAARSFNRGVDYARVSCNYFVDNAPKIYIWCKK